jgi:2-hydroxycyclohexanecarboxyl-CoA dehydrogenase
VAYIAYSFIGFEAAASIGEEVKESRKVLPKAVVLSLAVGGLLVIVACLGIVLAIPDMTAAVSGKDVNPVATTLEHAYGSGAGKTLLIALAVGFASSMIAVQTAVTRAIWASARDRMLPGTRLLGRLSGREHLPRYAIVLTIVIAGALIFAGASKVFALLVSFSAFGFILSYYLPIVALAADGHRVAVNDIADDGRLRDLAGRIGGVAVPADIADPDAGTGLARAVADRLGPVQILVANAAAMAMSPFLDARPDEWWRQVDVNLSGHFRLIQAVVPGMRARGHGRIVIIASGWGVIGHPNATAYAASKAGLIALAKGLGRELGPQGILANAIAPSYIDTEQLRVDADDAGISLDEMRQRYRELVPVRRLASPGDVAAAVSFLAGPGSSAVVGQVLQPSGGVTRTRA